MIRVADEVRDALAAGGAVVALETTLVAHGFPPGEGVEVGLESERQVRAAGAVPATIGVLDGEIVVGLSEDELSRFDAPARTNLAISTPPPELPRQKLVIASIARTTLFVIGRRNGQVSSPVLKYLSQL